MMGAQRWNFVGGVNCDDLALDDRCHMLKAEDGMWIEYADHERAMEEMRGLLKEWRNKKGHHTCSGAWRCGLCKRTDALLGGNNE